MENGTRLRGTEEMDFSSHPRELAQSVDQIRTCG